jgi:hypothetical protein
LRREDGELFSLHSTNPESHVEDDPEGSETIEVGAGVDRQRNLRNVWPAELKFLTGIAFVLTLCLAAAGLVFLDMWIRAHQGLPLLSTNAVTRQIVLNYIPTVRLLLLLLPMWLCEKQLMLVLALWHSR